MLFFWYTFYVIICLKKQLTLTFTIKLSNICFDNTKKIYKNVITDRLSSHNSLAKQFIDIDEMNDNLAKKAAATTTIEDLDADFYGDESFNEDEFDLEGFDEDEELDCEFAVYGEKSKQLIKIKRDKTE